MDESSMLSSRSAAIEALSSLSASHTKLQNLATGLVDRLFPGDGNTRDESIAPFVNLAFVAVTKARADLEGYAKSFAEVLKTLDAVRPSGVPAAAPTSPGAAQAPQLTGGQVESVGALKRKYEEGMAAQPAPKKTGPGPMGPKKGPMAKPAGMAKQAGVNVPVLAPQTPVTSNPAQESPKSPKSPSQSEISSDAAPAAASTPVSPVEVKSVENMAASEDSMTPRSPRPETRVESDVTSQSSSDVTGTTPTQSSVMAPVAATPRPDPANKEAMKKALEGMVLPNRKKAASPLPSSSSPVSSAGGGAPVVITSSVTASTVSPDHSHSEEANVSGGGASSNKARTSSNHKTSDPGTAGTTSDDEISSDEEEYLRGVEERRARAAAEKEERQKAARDAKEARQNMYAFLTEEPPPGFIQTKSTSATKDKKPKKEKKDKARDRFASQGRVPSDANLASAAPKGSAASPAGSASASAPTTPMKRPSERSVSVSGNGSSAPRITDLDLSSSGSRMPPSGSSPSASHQNPLLRESSGAGLGGSNSNAHLRSGSISGDNSWSTRYRPSNIVDDSVWLKAEHTILHDPPPSRKRWEEYQAKYAAKQEASAGKKQPNGGGFKSSSSTNVKSKSKGKQLSSDRDMTPDSPRRKSNADDSSPRTPDSPRRKSNADDSGEHSSATEEKRSNYGRSDSVVRRPPPKLDTVDDPRVYLFEAPNTDANLRFMERNGTETLAGGTIEKLIQHLTSASDPSPEYFQCFMLTYHNFLMPQELIELLRLRWNSQPSDPSKLDAFVTKDLIPIRLRIVNVLRMWIETFGNDFKDEAAMQALNSFVDYIRVDNPQMADLVALKLKKLASGHIFDAEGDIDEDPPPVHPFLKEGVEASPGLTDIHPEEFARQLALVEHALFKSIPYKELLTNAKAGKTNPNVSNMISYTNHLVNWIGTQIIKQQDLRHRAVAIARFITIAKYSIVSCQNYNGAMEVLSALRSSPVFRLKHTWNMLPDSTWDDYEWLEDLFESDNNYARYRKALSNAVPPCVPYLGRYLSEILFINEIHPDYLTQGPPPIINFSKMLQVADVLHHLQRYQKNPFCLTGAPTIQKFFLLKRGVVNEKELYKQSLEREPRDGAPSSSSPHP